MAADPQGVELVRLLIAHVRRFRLAEVETDVMKTLYESLIDRDQRHDLGEYYTPDWLAAKVIRNSVTRPLEQRVLDPACGSGAFLFHAVRAVLADAEDAAVAPGERARDATRLVAGLDIHPVAVIIARVTYLLALSPVRGNRSGDICIPVYLGDALQLSVVQTINEAELRIVVPPPPAGASQDGHSASNGKPREALIFPETFCRDSGLFDKALERMRSASFQDLTRPQVEAALTRITEQHYKADITAEQARAIVDLGATYALMDRLRRESRDTIWAYVARNLSRPLAFASGGGWANVVVGNPPWVAYRNMADDLKRRFRELAEAERIYVARTTSHNDLCALFAVRAAHLYLRAGGRLALVLPLAVLTRNQFEPLRTGAYQSLSIAWEEAWTMDEGVQPLFPVPSCAVFGRRRGTAVPMPGTVRAYRGTLPRRDAPEGAADQRLTATTGPMTLGVAQRSGGSPYRSAFRQGAILVPRMLALVTRRQSGRLGSNLAAPHVESARSAQEKRPWRDLPAIDNPVEAEFLRPALLGESILPYRVWRPFEAVIPAEPDGRMLDAEAAAARGIPNLTNWMRKAEAVWNTNGKGRRTFIEQLNYINQLSSQLPIAPLRVVYTKAGTNLAAAIVRDAASVIDHKLYWYARDSEAHAAYLAAILNSETTRALAAKYQARGLFGARDFDKTIWNLPIPRFKPTDPLHADLATAGAEAEALAATIPLAPHLAFTKARATIRSHLAEAGLAQRIDALVARLLAPPD